jgi:hypothetical protein
MHSTRTVLGHTAHFPRGDERWALCKDSQAEDHMEVLSLSLAPVVYLTAGDISILASEMIVSLPVMLIKCLLD